MYSNTETQSRNTYCVRLIDRYEWCWRPLDPPKAIVLRWPALLITPVGVSRCRDGGGVPAEDEVVSMVRRSASGVGGELHTKGLEHALAHRS
jgi:hypothetical protein